MIFEPAVRRLKNQIPNTKFQIPNKFQIRMANHQNVLFGTWNTEIYLEFGAWNLVLI